MTICENCFFLKYQVYSEMKMELSNSCWYAVDLPGMITMIPKQYREVSTRLSEMTFSDTGDITVL